MSAETKTKTTGIEFTVSKASFLSDILMDPPNGRSVPVMIKGSADKSGSVELEFPSNFSKMESMRIGIGTRLKITIEVIE